MLVHTPAIVLHTTRVNDKTVVLHLYTREFGRMECYVYGGSRKGRGALFTPLSLIDAVADRNPLKEVHTLKDFSLRHTTSDISSDIRRITVAIFIAEVLYRTLTLPESDAVMFDFIEKIILTLNNGNGVENLHLMFLVEYISLLGFAPDRNTPANAALFPCLSLTDRCSNGQRTPFVDRPARQAMLDTIMVYYTEHLPGFVKPKSLDVLKQVFD